MTLAGGLSGCTARTGEDRLDERGRIEIRIDGESVDLSADRFQAEHADDYAMEFHLHEGDDHWYMEGRERVTVAEALDLLPHIGFAITDDRQVLTIDDTTYDERDEHVEITVHVGEEPVNPDAYELRDGDAILVDVRTT